MIISIDVTLAGATRTVTIDPDGLSMGFFEDLEAAQETGKLASLLSAYAAMLGFTRDEVRNLTRRQFEAIAVALQNAVDSSAVPNGNAPD